MESNYSVVNHNTDRAIYIYFWLFGLINNILYVVILSAAVDIVGPRVPKSLVLLVDILPSLLIKLLSPFFIHRIKYGYRIISLIIVGCFGMILVSSGRILICLLGVALASLSAGFGEVTFLQMTHIYKEVSLSGWSSGTGGAGLLGSAIYMMLTTILHVPTKVSLLLFSATPFGFLLYFRLQSYEHGLASIDDTLSTPLIIESQEILESDIGLMSEVNISKPAQINTGNLKEHILETLLKLRKLVLPYMLPLTTVYLFEYLINQSVSPTLLFPIDNDNSKHSSLFKFHKYRDIYVTYGTLYQIGVFISRSTAYIFRLKNLYLLSVLQFINLVITLFQSWNYIVKRPLPIMMLVLYEGLLGGSSYVNTFLNILENVSQEEQEFALGSVSIADSLGVLIAALIGLKLEPTLCRHQVEDNRPWCTLE